MGATTYTEDGAGATLHVRMMRDHMIVHHLDHLFSTRSAATDSLPQEFWSHITRFATLRKARSDGTHQSNTAEYNGVSKHKKREDGTQLWQAMCRQCIPILKSGKCGQFGGVVLASGISKQKVCAGIFGRHMMTKHPDLASRYVGLHDDE